MNGNQLLKDKNAIIYGGSGAIGGAVARTFAREGARVFIAGRTTAKLDAVARDIVAAGGIVEIAQLDSLDEQAVNEHAAAVSRKAGGIDVALNAVSFMHDQGTLLPELSLETFMLPIDKFLRSLFITTKAVVPHMGRKRPGVVLTLSTPAAKMTVAGHLGHGVSCAGIETFSRMLAADLAPNIRVVCIRPHAIADAPAAGSYTGTLFEPKASAAGISVQQWLAGAAGGTLLQRLPNLAEVAETAAFLASDRAGAMTATVANLTCGVTLD
jgi:NAD(P)-dependent dehydrogenase (short-subunit alcohol dehydrogenase family)